MSKIKYTLKILFLFASSIACSSSDPQESSPNVSQDASISANHEEDIEQSTSEFNPANCPESAVEVPIDMSIAKFVDYLNSLPKPLTASCLLHYLPKPLLVDATSDEVSAQPAVGRQNPRLFFKVGKLYISIALTNTGSQRLEISEIVSETRAVKAEIGFPRNNQLAESQPYQRARLNERGTTCSICHSGETEAGEGFPLGAFESDMVRPIPRLDVTLNDLKRLAQSCTVQDLGGKLRCEILDIITAENAAIPYEFSTVIPTRDDEF